MNSVIFDLDGTLLDTLTDLHQSVNHALALYDCPKRSVEEVRAFLGNGIGELVRLSLPSGHSETLYNKVLSSFQQHYAQHQMDHTQPYEGVQSLLQTLSKMGYRLAIVSNKIQPAVTALDVQFFAPFIHTAIGERLGVPRKPAPDMIYLALQSMGTDRTHCLYIGDSEVDLATAQQAKMASITVTWGFRDREYLVSQGATRLVDNTQELLQAIQEALPINKASERK